MGLALAVHGGAWNIPDRDVDATLNGVRAALGVGWSMLRQGASAVDTVEHVVRVLEDDPTFNAGTGSHMNRHGHVELDASIMEGDGLQAGAVAAVQRIRNPIALARRVMEGSPHVLLVGRGASMFAREQGIAACNARDLLVGRARELYCRVRAGETDLIDAEFLVEPGAEHMGTVGAAARDAHGLLAAGTSTGGTLGKRPGRVGDSPVIGAGTYADSRCGAASCTGWGEGILRVVLAKTAIDRLTTGHSAAAAGAAAMRDLDRVEGRGGLILLDANGNAVAAFNTPRMARGIATEASGLGVGVDGLLQRCDG